MLSFFTIMSPWDTAITAFAYRIDNEAAEEKEDANKNASAHHQHFSEGFRDCNPRQPDHNLNPNPNPNHNLILTLKIILT